MYALSAILLWATFAYLGLRLAAVPPFLLVGIALTIGSLFSIHRFRECRVSFSILLLGVYGLFGYHLCLFMALRLAPPVEANLLNYLWPLLIVLLSPLFLPDSRIGFWHVLSGVLGFSGAALLITQGKLGFSSGFSSHDILGYGLACAAALIWATYSLMSKRIRRFPTSAIGLLCLVSGLLSLGSHFLFEPSYSITSQELPWLVLLGLGPMGGAFFLWDAAIKQGDVRVVGSLAYLTPMLSTLLLVVSGFGQLRLTSLIAMGFILGGAALGSWASRVRGLSQQYLYRPQ